MKDKEENVTTAWFLDILSLWYRMLTSKSAKFSLSYLDMNKFHESVAFLEEVMFIFQNLYVEDPRHTIRPGVRGLLTSTKSYIGLSKDLLDIGFKYVQGCKITTDAVENLFSILRMNNPRMNAAQFEQKLKKVVISLYSKTVWNGSYIIYNNHDSPDEEHIFDYFESTEFKQAMEEYQNQEDDDVEEDESIEEYIPMPAFDTLLDNSLYVGGYVLGQAAKHTKSCLLSCLKNQILAEPEHRLLNIHTTPKIQKLDFYFGRFFQFYKTASEGFFGWE